MNISRPSIKIKILFYLMLNILLIINYQSKNFHFIDHNTSETKVFFSQFLNPYLKTKIHPINIINKNIQWKPKPLDKFIVIYIYKIISTARIIITEYGLNFINEILLQSSQLEYTCYALWYSKYRLILIVLIPLTIMIIKLSLMIYNRYENIKLLDKCGFLKEAQKDYNNFPLEETINKNKIITNKILDELNIISCFSNNLN